MKLLPRFLLLVGLFSLPLWLAAQFLDATKIIPVKLPLSALQFLSVLLAAIMVTRQEGKPVRNFLAQGFDFKRIGSPRWRVGVFVLMPLVVLLAYGLAALADRTIASQLTPVWSAPIFLLIYGFSGYCEQMGWTGIMTNALLPRYGIVKTGLWVGFTWAVWHIIPFMQTHNPADWILWQCIYTILYRVLITKIYVATNRSVFSTIALHATYNTAFSLMPYFGSSYNPAFMALVTLMAVAMVFIGENALQRNQLASVDS